MSKTRYEPRTFTPAAQLVIEQAEAFCQEYAAQGYSLTLRQLYYRFIATDSFPESRRDASGTKNNERNYKWLGGLVSDARVDGQIDWTHLVDRTRSVAGGDAAWDDPAALIDYNADMYSVTHWADMPDYLEVWVEKEALVDVIARPAQRWRVARFACKGYVSQSEMHEAAMRIRRKVREGKKVTILHLGDHDPSGLDMTEDIRRRMAMFRADVTVNRLALNMDQVEQFSPPPSPAKITDSRARDYIEVYGDDSWELDALEPQFLDDLVDGAIQEHVDQAAWDRAEAKLGRERELLRSLSRNWDQIVEHMAEAGMTSPDPEDDEDA